MSQSRKAGETAREHATRFAVRATVEADEAMIAYYRRLATTWENVAAEEQFAAELKVQIRRGD